ncbi:aldehyde dehydrogenase [Lampropedia puyangensis]|uniref:4-(hydroxymethyl)benzenesulfonate dehydrogenase n=1 Tax=Lampropedia puyangensis TaxID=1330072 RepID=A0A4S8FD87_9BURK|nr:aldehyde dehydrogenase [Lampropedia puyangensis]THU05490.1 aldehyde dehydrogenase [Lampropedia puyangensis]
MATQTSQTNYDLAANKNKLISINPANGQVAGEVQKATAQDVDACVQTAWDAFHHQAWSGLRQDQRATVLYAIGQGILAERESLAALQMRDSGKPYKECLHMVDSAAGNFRYYAAVCETLQGALTPARGEYFSMALAEPFGVVACITPWNSPIMNEAQKAAPALAAGNAVILKPSEETPQLAFELLRIAQQAGLPTGMLQVLAGDGEDVGAALVKHAGVRMVSFTGGTDTGRAIGAIAGQRLIPVALELGGKSPHIVCEDADQEKALAAVISGIFGSAGQSCVAGSRLFVQRTIYKAFVNSLAERTRQIRVALPDDPTVQVGPLISLKHRQRVANYVELARHEGGEILAGGMPPSGSELQQGAFYMPTLIDGLSNSARVCQEEIFGPVLVALPFDDEDDLIAQANDTAFGLGAGIWTSDYAKAWRIARAIQAGSVWINTYKQSHIATPFGGFKDSGIGREKGIEGLKLYSQNKSIYWGLHQAPMALG